jgi:hypothetical protein
MPMKGLEKAVVVSCFCVLKLCCMPMQPKTFAHRYTEDDLIESICMTCFLTAARSLDEREMRKNEARHVCHPAPLPLASHFQDA